MEQMEMIAEEKILAANTELKSKTLGANWFRRLGMVGTGILFLAISVASLYMAISGKAVGSDMPLWFYYTFGLLMGAISLAATSYAILSLFVDKVILNKTGIELKTLFNKYQIPSDKIIRIDSYTETVDFAPFMTLKRFTVVTNTKSYELCDHDFWGLESSLDQWLEAFEPTENVDKTRIDQVFWRKNLFTNTCGFLGIEGDTLIFSKYRGVYRDSQATYTSGEIVMNRYLDKLRSLIQPEKELWRAHKSMIMDAKFTKIDPTNVMGRKTYSTMVEFNLNGTKYSLSYAARNQEKLDYFNSFFQG